jgi:anti-repressor protein
MELIKIYMQNNHRVVNARELHEFLENKRQFSDWIKQRIDQYGFIENHDYIRFSQNCEKPSGGRPSLEYGLTLDMSKELSMVENNEKGKIARRYFIQKEKEASVSISTISRKDLAKMLLESEEEKERLIEDVARLGTKALEQQRALEAAAPKVLFADTVSASSSSILVGELAKLICQRGVEIGQNRLFDWMRRNGYLLSRPGEYYNRPAQRYIEQGLFELKKTSITRGDGTILVTTTTKVTGKGQVYFVDKFLGSFSARDMLKNVNSEKITV